MATLSDFSIDHRGNYIPDPWGWLQYGSDQMIAVTVNPLNGNVFTLGQFLWALGVAPSPPPLPPNPPPPPPSPPPNPAPASPLPAPSTVACYNVAHRFAAAPAVSGAYADTGHSPAWSGAAMGWAWPSSKYPPQDYGISVLSGDYDQPIGSELYNAQWGALSFTGEEGMLVDTAADAYVGDATAGLSVSIWFTPRGTTLGPQAKGRNVLLTMAKHGSNGGRRSTATHNTTLRLVYTHNGDVSLGQQSPNVRASVVQCCTAWGDPVTTTSDYTAQARKLRAFVAGVRFRLPNRDQASLRASSPPAQDVAASEYSYYFPGTKPNGGLLSEARTHAVAPAQGFTSHAAPPASRACGNTLWSPSTALANPPDCGGTAKCRCAPASRLVALACALTQAPCAFTQSAASLFPTQLGALPFGPISVLSVAYDAGRRRQEHLVNHGEWRNYVPLQGDVADVQFYDYALTAQQVAGLYTGDVTPCGGPPAPSPPPPRPPLAPGAVVPSPPPTRPPPRRATDAPARDTRATDVRGFQPVTAATAARRDCGAGFCVRGGLLAPVVLLVQHRAARGPGALSLRADSLSLLPQRHHWL